VFKEPLTESSSAQGLFEHLPTCKRLLFVGHRRIEFQQVDEIENYGGVLHDGIVALREDPDFLRTLFDILYLFPDLVH
jgi:hypothetical protein